MTTLQKTIVLIATLLVLVLGVGGLYYGGAFIAEKLATLDRTVVSITLIAAVTALLCARIVAGGLRRAQQEAHHNHTWRQRAETYERLLEIWATHSTAAGGHEPRLSEDLQTDLLRAERQLLLRAGSDVIQHYNAIRSAAAAAGAQAIEPLLKAMRSDLGQRNFTLRSGDLSALFKPGT